MKVSAKIDLKYAQACISEHEPVARNLSDLTQKVSFSYNEKFKTKYSGGLFYLRIKSGELTTNIKAGKKGRLKGSTGIRKRITGDLAALKRMHPEYSSLCEKVAEGSRSAAIKLKCLNCCGFQSKEVSLCNSVDCALFQFRPYQRRK